MKEQENSESEVVKYIGFSLLAVGVFVAGLIILEIFTFFSKPEENVLVQYMTVELSKTDFAELNERPIVLKESGAFAVSVFLFAILIWTASSVSHHVIKAGLSIITRTYTADIARLKSYVAEIGTKLEKAISDFKK